jgi:hypothetical protein
MSGFHPSPPAPSRGRPPASAMPCHAMPKAWHGKAWQGMARHAMARHGRCRREGEEQIPPARPGPKPGPPTRSVGAGAGRKRKPCSPGGPGEATHQSLPSSITQMESLADNHRVSRRGTAIRFKEGHHHPLDRSPACTAKAATRRNDLLLCDGRRLLRCKGVCKEQCQSNDQSINR